MQFTDIKRVLKIVLIVFIILRILQQLQIDNLFTYMIRDEDEQNGLKSVTSILEGVQSGYVFEKGSTRYRTPNLKNTPGSDPRCFSSKALNSDKRFFKVKRLIYTFKTIILESLCSFDVWKSFFGNNLLSLRMTLVSNVFPLLEVGGSNMITKLSLGKSVYQDSRLMSKIKTTGTQHLLAVSGMHLSIFLRLVATPFRGYLSKRWFGIWSFWLILGYLSLVDPSHSLLRAGMMAFISILSSLLSSRQYNPLFAILLCFFTLICVDISIINSLSFQMSFVATTSIVLSTKYGFTRGLLSDLHLQNYSSRVVSYSNKEKILEIFLSYIKDSLKVGVTVQILLLPLVMYHFGVFSLVSILASVLVSWLLPLLIPISIFTIISSSILLEFGFLLQIFLLPARFFSSIFILLLEVFNSEIFLIKVEWFSFWHLIIWWSLVVLIFLGCSKINKQKTLLAYL